MIWYAFDKIRAMHIDVTAAISDLQAEARLIRMAETSDCKPAQGGLPGPAFFPEGLGLSEHAMDAGVIPIYMAVGHNFGCEDYRSALNARGREDNIIGTWQSLDRLLAAAHSNPDLWYRTNWFVGLRPGSENDGPFLTQDDESYETNCSRLLLKQIELIKPRTILLLGPVVTRRSYRISPSLGRWRFSSRNKIRFADIDNQGHTVRNATFTGMDHRANVVSLLHPSKGWLNEPRRSKRIGLKESQLIEAVL